MRSIFLKIFLWFWLTVVLIVSILEIMSAISRNNFEQTEWQSRVFVAGEAARAVDIYEQQGAAALREHFQHLPKPGLETYLIDDHGTEVLGQKAPQQAIQFMHKDPADPVPSLLLGPGPRVEKLNPPFSYVPKSPQEPTREPLTPVPVVVPPKPIGGGVPAAAVRAERIRGAS